MTKESEIAALLLADAPLVAILTGGIYTDQEIGVEGIRRGEDSPTEAAFDVDGRLLPCAVVRQRGEFPYGDWRSLKEKTVAVSQVVEVYYYEFRGHDQIDLAKYRACEVLEGVRLTDSYPIWWIMETSHIPDVGPVMNATVLRQDWQVISIRRPA